MQMCNSGINRGFSGSKWFLPEINVIMQIMVVETSLLI